MTLLLFIRSLTRPQEANYRVVGILAETSVVMTI